MLKFVSPIESPYRIDMFNDMRDKNIDIFVYFLSVSRPGRDWKKELIKKFDYRTISRNFGWFGAYYFFIPFSIVKDLSTSRDTWILGSSWNSPLTLTLLFLSKLRKGSRVFLWIELNQEIDNKKTSFQLAVRNWILSRASGLVVPNKMAKDYVQTKMTNERTVVILPNYVDSSRFVPGEPVNQEEAYLLIPARFVEERKGHLLFFKNLGVDKIRTHNWLLIGKGKDERHLRKFLDTHNLKNVEIKTFVEYDEMVHIYKSAKGFILPSLHDPSPLAVIEAAAMGLPLLVSNKCGNSQDFVFSHNGKEFDPYSRQSVRKAWAGFETILEQSAQPKEMRVVFDYESSYKELIEL